MIKQTTFLILFSQFLLFGTIDRIQKAMDKKEYEKAHELILKGYEKEPGNPGISYYHSKLLFDEAYAKYHLDSARIAIEMALEKYNQASQELKEELSEEGITLDTIIFLHEKIRDRVFQNTLADFSIEKASSFEQRFPNSIYSDLLIYKIDSIEYREARLSNSQSALISFIADNPTSVFKPKADSLLDDLRFDELDKNGNLADYYHFHANYPSSRHNANVESYILRASTASHHPETYMDFIGLATTASLKKKAADILFYLSNKQDYLSHPKSDSLRKVKSLSEVALYPAVQNGLYGFYDPQGQLRIQPLYTEISDAYKCVLTQDDWIYAENKNGGLILTKDGKVVLEGIDGYRSVSEEIGLILKDREWFLYHKSGFSILDQAVEDAEIIADKWIKVKSGNQWGLFSFLGLPIAELRYNDIYKLESFWIFEKNDLLAVYTEELILDEIEARGVTLEFKFDDIELVNENALIGFRRDRECLLDSTLNFRIPWGEYEIYPDEAGWYIKSANGYRVYDPSKDDLINRHFPYLESNNGWLALKTETDWILVPRKDDLPPSLEYDSIKLINDFAAVLVKGEKKTLQFISGEELDLKDQRIQIFQNHEEFISLIDGENTTIFDGQGKEVVSGKFQRTTFLSDSLIRVQIRNKQGLMHVSGDWILNPVFDNINEKDGLVLTLIDGKIGCYDPSVKQLITTGYEARLERIKDHYLAKQDGKLGIIDRAKNEIISFNYDEITYWNDTSYLVRKEGQFLIINEAEEPVYDPIERIELLVSNDDHSIYKIVKNGKYGLISNQHSELLKSEFTDIMNIGSENEPLIFADQHLDKAGFHVVSYVDERGELILSKAYTKKEFEGILCDD